MQTPTLGTRRSGRDRKSVQPYTDNKPGTLAGATSEPPESQVSLPGSPQAAQTGDCQLVCVSLCSCSILMKLPKRSGVLAWHLVLSAVIAKSSLDLCSYLLAKPLELSVSCRRSWRGPSRNPNPRPGRARSLHSQKRPTHSPLQRKLLSHYMNAMKLLTWLMNGYLSCRRSWRGPSRSRSPRPGRARCLRSRKRPTHSPLRMRQPSRHSQHPQLLLTQMMRSHLHSL